MLALVDELNADDEVDGILVQLPLPGHIDETKVTYAVAPHKDVDGFHPVNAGNLYLGTPLHVPATPVGCMELLAAHGDRPHGEGGGRHRPQRDRREARRDAPPAGERDRHGLPLANGRPRGGGAARATSSSPRWACPGIVTADMVKPGAAVLDVGLTRTEEGIRGDVDPAVAEVAGHLTPMPGGTGPMTIAMLLRSAIKAARYRRGLLAYPTSSASVSPFVHLASTVGRCWS